MLAIVGTVYMRRGFSLDVGSVSPKRFDAVSTIENKYATEKLRNEAMENVLPVYTFDKNVQENTVKEVSQFLSTIEAYRYAKSREPYTLSSIVYSFVNKTKNKFTLSAEHLNTIDSMDDDTFRNFEQALNSTAAALMTKEIKSDSEISNYINECMDEYFVDFTQKRYSLASYILSATVTVNCILDEEATRVAKEQKAASVEPILVLKNQKIIDEGEIINEETLSILKDFGYVNRSNGFYDNIPKIIGTGFLVFIVFIFTFYFLNQFMRNTDGEYKKAEIIFTVYVGLLISTIVLRSFHYTITAVIVFSLIIAFITDLKTGIALNAAASVICCLMYGCNIEFLIYYFVVGTAAVILSKYTSLGTMVLYSAAGTMLISAVTIAGITLMTDNAWKGDILKDCVYAFVMTGLSYVIAVGSLPAFETFFAVATNVRLLELINPDKELLRRLLIEAPGTYHHSLIVANLAEAACSKIGANAVLARVGAYYHDIGKLKKPYYFTENIIGKNPHDDFEPPVSASIIINHIKDGLELADKYKLPEPVKKIIRQHHGTSVVRFFYYKAKEMYGEENVKKDDYCYKNELPDTKESAVIMLADICEAAVRSMLTTGKSSEEIENFINKLVQDKISERQFIDCDISFKELNIIIGAFMEIFNGMYHKRIQYPEDKSKS